ncbi:hypothetical protein PN466_14320 [Roseofilum reptotaenium CS-1145]|uniref:Uncharacterized protein n=1 Tax=Roseofilum reptotaenium AO1-A TaxID=1925591 RepID=A0A1L9QVW4_9CYAN|nr:hypothetical protein [Roseofilum reptotaenium CS-1145]OJJ26803.1 hypothetical protein BI308_03660 [Roseofilum reptotaenium AO1-A]
MWMIKNQGNFTVVHEPFGKSAYYSEERIFHSESEVKPQPEYNYDVVLQHLVSILEKGPVFVKDFPYYFLHRVDNRFLSLFQDTLLLKYQ